MAKNYQVVFQAAIDTAQLQKEAQKALGNTSIPFNTKGMKGYGAAAKQSAGMLGEFGAQLRNLSSTIPKVAAFGVATAAIGAFTSAIRSGIDAVFEMDAALIEYQKVSDLSGEALEQFTEQATEMGLAVARTGSEMVNAATQFKKSGYTDAESLGLSKMAALFQNIADEELTAAESSSFLVSQMKAFNITADDSITILDAVNNTANNMAVGTGDLQKALEVASSGLVTYNNTLSNSIALVTAGTEIMVGRSSQVARGLNTIASRIVKNADALAEYGIATTDAEGNLRSTYDILKDLAPVWKTMGDEQRIALGQTLAGVNQYRVLAAVMGNFDAAIKANSLALNGSGSAMQENARYMESLEAHLSNLRAEFEALANNTLRSDFIKAVIDSGTAILKFANSDAVKFTAKVAAFTAGIYLAVKAVVALSGALWGLAVNHPILLGITAITAGAIALSKAIKTDQERFDELKETLQETNDALSQTQSEYDALASKAPTELTQAEKERLSVLKEELAVLKEQQKVQQQQLYDAYKSPTLTKVNGSKMVGGGLGFQLDTTTTSIEDYTKTLSKLSDAEDEAREKMSAHAKQLMEFRDAGVSLDRSQQDFLATYNALTAASNLATESYHKYGNVIGGIVEKEIDKLSSKYKDNKQALTDLLNAENSQEFALNAVKNAAISYINSQSGMQVSVNATTQEIRKQLVALAQQAVAAANAYEAQRIAAGDEKRVIANSEQMQALMVNVTKASNALYALDKVLNQTTTDTSGNGGYTDAVSSASSATEKQTDATRDLTDALKDQSSALEQAAEFMITRLDEEISALEAQKQALQDTNQELEDQLELEEALDALARAKANKVLTYSGGQFIYSADASAVGEAQKRVDEVRRKQAQQAQIDAIDERIDAIKAEQDNWRKVKNAYNDYLGAQQLGVNAEGDVWKKRIGQAEQYANQYLKIMQTMAGVESGAISLSTGKSILASSKNFGKNLSGSSAYKSLLEPSSSTLTTSRIASMSTADLKRVVNQYFGDISLPNVSNAEQFVEDLKNFQQFASQSATSR